MKKTIIIAVVLVLIVAAGFAFYKIRSVRNFSQQLTQGGEARSVSEVAPFDLAFCEDTLATEAGTLCAIKPSATDPQIADAASTGEKGDAVLGFGYHVVAVPNDWTHAKGVWIHLTGSYGRPYDQRRDSYESSLWLNELMEEGYVVIQLAYDNRFSVNGDLCGARNEGHDRDNCAGEVREIALTGEGSSPYRSTNTYNTIDYRLEALLGYLADTHGIDLPGNIDPDAVDWSKLSVSGHSQGANQAYYIAKKRPVSFACVLAGGYDTADTVNPDPLNIADWFTEGASATPVSKIGAILTTTDDGYKAFLAGLTEAVELPRDRIVVSDKKEYFDTNGKELNGHAGTIKDPSLKADRSRACFR